MPDTDHVQVVVTRTQKALWKRAARRMFGTDRKLSDLIRITMDRTAKDILVPGRNESTQNKETQDARAESEKG